MTRDDSNAVITNFDLQVSVGPHFDPGVLRVGVLAHVG
jgi:hypothetical protein